MGRGKFWREIIIQHSGIQYRRDINCISRGIANITLSVKRRIQGQVRVDCRRSRVEIEGENFLI